MSDQAMSGEPATTVGEWARRQAPHLDVVSASVPDPVLDGRTLIARFDESERARDLVLAWERIEPADGGVGTVVLGIAPDRPSEIERDSGVDPEGVTEHAVIRSLQGGIPGAIIGAVIGAAIAWLIGGWSGAVAASALGAAAFGAVAGAVMVFTKGTGWGSAYKHSFVDDEATSIVFASITSDDPDRLDEAMEAAIDAEAQLYRVDSNGRCELVNQRR
jgi:hypothetical protein